MKHISRICFTYLILLYLFFACFRNQYVGKDTINYINIFIRISEISWEDLFAYSMTRGTEIGYVIYNKLLSLITTDTYIVTLANSTLLYIALYQLLKNTVDPVLSLFLFLAFGLFQDSFNVTISMLVTLLAFGYLKKQKSIVQIFLVFAVLSLFHRAVFIVLIAYAASCIKPTRKSIGFCAVAGLLIGFAYERLLPYFISIAPTVYRNYLYKDVTASVLPFFYHMMLVSLVLVIQKLSNYNYNDDSTEIRINTWGTIIEIAALFLATKAIVFSRVARLFMPAFLIYLPASIKVIPVRNNRKILYALIVLLSTFQYIVRLNINNIGGTIPYSFLF